MGIALVVETQETGDEDILCTELSHRDEVVAAMAAIA